MSKDSKDADKKADHKDDAKHEDHAHTTKHEDHTHVTKHDDHHPALNSVPDSHKTKHELELESEFKDKLKKLKRRLNDTKLSAKKMLRDYLFNIDTIKQ